MYSSLSTYCTPAITAIQLYISTEEISDDEISSSSSEEGSDAHSNERRDNNDQQDHNVLNNDIDLNDLWNYNYELRSNYEQPEVKQEISLERLVDGKEGVFFKAQLARRPSMSM